MAEQDQLNRVYEKIQLLVSRVEFLQKENESIKRELRETQKLSTARQSIISDLEQTINVLRTAPGKMEEADRKELDKKLSSYLKEIDRCITLLEQ